MNRDWHKEAGCTNHPDPDLWHYENSIYADEQQLTVLRSIQAIEVCNDCPVRTQCLAQGLERENVITTNGVGSIWGGLLQGERALMVGFSHSHAAVKHEQRHRRDVRKKIARIKV